MAFTTEELRKYPFGPSEKAPVNTTDGLIPWRFMISFAAIVSAAMIGVRVYQQIFAWSAGLDYFEPEFQTYWMTFLYSEWVMEAILATSIWGYIWVTRDRHLDQLQPVEELRRYFRLIALIFAYVFVIYWTGSFFAEQDAAWHQVALRDTDFTPSHIPLFYLSVPCYIIAGVSAFLYARTRLPEFAKRWSVPFIIGVAGPFLILPNLGYNEWGHTFFFMEERFAAPIHWGFVILGWSALALGGLLFQILRRLVELTDVPSRGEA